MAVEGSIQKGSLVFDPSANVSFGVFDAAGIGRPEYADMSVVVIGGGTGAPMSIRAATALGVQTSAVVAMADDGGSTGIIRRTTSATPPGDIRKCLAAFARDPEDPFVQAFSARLLFDDDHALGNLLLVALEQTSGGFMEAIALCERMLDALGHVYPCTLTPVGFSARTVKGEVLDGQKASSHADTPLEQVWLTSETDSVEAHPAAIEAIMKADLAILGPGSLFTSVISNLAVPGIAEALRRSNCAVAYVCSVADTQGETRGMGVSDYVEALERHGLAGCLDYVLVNDRALSAAIDGEILPVLLSEREKQELASRGIEAIAAPLADDSRPTWHNPRALCAAIAEVLDRCLSRKR